MGVGKPAVTRTSVGQNVGVEIDANEVMTIKVDLKQQLRPTKKGDRMLIGTTAGTKRVAESGGVNINLNVTAPLE